MPTQHSLNHMTKALRLRQAFKSRLPAVALAATLPLAVQAQTQEWQLNIPAQPLNQALQELASKTGVQLLYNPGNVEGLRSTALNGRYQLADAIKTIIYGTGLSYGLNGNTVTLQLASKDSLQLSATEITSQKPGAVTEGTGSYTTGVTSTATKMNLSIRETPQSISVVTRQRMDDQNLTSITKVLEQTPGITISRDASERFNIYSRGNEITKYQYDGLTTHVQNQTQNMTQNLTDMSIYDTIEIVRGATGLMTGAGSPSGMVNMVRKKPTREFQASLEGSVGRWDDYRGQVDVSGPLIESGKLRARLVGAKQDNDTFTDYYSQKRDVLYGVAEADITDTTTVRFGIDYQKYEVDGQTGVPLFYTDGEQTNFSRSTTVGSKHRNQELETTNYFFNIDQALANGWKLVIAGNYMDVDRDISNSFSMNAGTSTAVDRETGEFTANRTNKITNPLNQKSAAINLQGPFSLFGREHQVIVGYEFSRYKSHYESYGYGSTTSNLSTVHEIPPVPNDNQYSAQDFYIIQRGYYGVLRLNPVDKLHVILGARASDYKYDTYYDAIAFGYGYGSSYEKTGEVTPYAGLVYDLTPEQSIYASYTDIFTPNNVNDISGQVIEPQVGSNYEIGWKGEFYDGRLNANVAIYQVKRDNATELAGYNSSNVAYYRAIDGMETKGIDIEIAGEVLPGWNVSGSYSHSRSEDADGARQTTEHPLDTVKLWNTYNFSGEWQNLTIGSGARWVSKTTAYYTNLSSKAIQDDYVVVDAMARYKFNQHLSGTLNINNLFDKKYYTAIGGLAYGYYGAPRNITLGARYEF
ncbi:TonB-dependent siderophore receptor [Stutzerimonas kirkiae]|uniref:TonB-dependent siderophore receptor n=1 Tax=Stutzerimonas kirkiae TaxID=2211392 RepID=A0A4Q9QVU3_9GAMM|nr:TonB-dependent receptor [Stutzerimonas kirkiae]TBU88047.1 TonB-dependent siderophore receptor [Stutzerimonas kirkiae]TBU98204.1 TonB-dependent siderophore receptor [Stutzerimonas kirkiae]